MKTRVIQDDAEPADALADRAALGGGTGTSKDRPHGTDKELIMATVAVPAPSAVDAPYAGPVVSADKLTRRYGDGETAVDALRGVSLDVAGGALTAVMGPSGSGKSTLMHILAGLDKATAGEVTLAGTAISALNDNDLTKLRRRHIGFIFQFFNLLPMLTAEENVVLPLTIAGEKPEKKWLEELMKSVGLQDRRTHRPSELSGGQQQRVAIGRALISRPTIVFADEPTGNLDSKTSSEILALMRHSVDAYGQTTVMVTHDARAAAIADRILFLADGRIVRDVGRSDAREVIAVMDELAR
jgi:putative ABC transport system ATP-binding protein